MRSVVRLGTVGSLVAAAVVAGACGSDNNNMGPNGFFPIIGGTYTGNITYSLTTGGPPIVANPPLTIQMSDPDNNGNFAGSFSFNSGFTGTGNVLGQFSQDGSTIDWTQFGDAGQPLFFVSSFLTANFPNCVFVPNQTTFTLDQGGGFGNDGSLNLSGTYNNVHCATDNAGDSVSNATMNVSLTSFNPAPAQKVSHGMAALHSVLRGGIQHVR
jgi:hypothetical protein